MRYELFYLIGAARESDLDKIKGDIKKIVVEETGVFEEKETQEKRKLSYKVKHETHGVYVAHRFELDPEKLQPLIKKLNLHTEVLRFIISRADELPELKTKEERIAQAERQEKKKNSAEKIESDRVAARSTAGGKKKEEKPAETKDEKKAGEDIDKKLEEILNI